MTNIITPGLALKAAVPGDDRRGGALTTNNTVSETNKFGVDAVELNPNIEGTIAYNLANSLSSNGLTTPIKFGYDSENDVYGYIKAGADTVTPFKSGIDLTIFGRASAGAGAFSETIIKNVSGLKILNATYSGYFYDTSYQSWGCYIKQIPSNTQYIFPPNISHIDEEITINLEDDTEEILVKFSTPGTDGVTIDVSIY